MNTIEVRNFLRRYKEISRQVEQVLLRLEEIQTQLEKLGAVDYSRIVVGGTSGDKTATETALDRKTELINNLNTAVKNKYETEKEIKSFICLLSNRDSDCDMLVDYYINRLTLMDLSKKYNREYETVKWKLKMDYKKLAHISFLKDNTAPHF